jgi:NADH pyrophosphatase NudC (nudix superfamily)
MHTARTQKVNREEFMFCFNCGTKLPTEAMFCSNCGAKMASLENANVESSSSFDAEKAINIGKKAVGILGSFLDNDDDDDEEAEEDSYEEAKEGNEEEAEENNEEEVEEGNEEEIEEEETEEETDNAKTIIKGIASAASSLAASGAQKAAQTNLPRFCPKCGYELTQKSPELNKKEEKKSNDWLL